MARVTPSTRTAGTVTSGAQTTSVSIPSGSVSAVIAIVFHNSVANQAPTSVSLDGQTATKIDSIENVDSNQVAIYYATGFSTGASKTLAYTNPTTQNFLNVAIEYRDTTLTAGAHSNARNGGPSTASTASLANTAGDEIIAGWGTDNGTTVSAGTGQTILDNTLVGSQRFGFTTETATGASDVQSITGDYPGIAAAVFTPGEGGGGGTTGRGRLVGGKLVGGNLLVRM